MELHEFKKVSAFFHDGTIDHFENTHREIYMWMESAELELEWVKKFQVKVNRDMRIKGVLHLINVRGVTINGIAFNEYNPRYEISDILHLYVSKNQISMFVCWKNRSLVDKSEAWQKVIIEADKIFWIYDDYIKPSSQRSFKSDYIPHALG